MIKLKPFEIIIDAIILFVSPSINVALKAVTYKAVKKKLVQIAFKKASKGIVTFMSKFGVNVAANVIVAKVMNNTIYKYASRFVTVGGLLCLVLDAYDGKVDYWFKWK